MAVKNMIGRIHSIESMGLNDGPGVRSVIFFQGCRLRCAYCHNPDTWSINEGNEVTPEELINKIVRFKSYFNTSGGGVTCSGGEPLLQPDFLIEFFKLCKSNNIHTALDTAGFGMGRYDEILEYTDLVLLDIKHVDNEGYKDICGGAFKEVKDFINALNKSNTDIWIRHVVVPGITDGERHIDRLNKVISKVDNVKKVELLPYHTLGKNKYDSMNIPYRLEGVKPMCKEKIKILNKRLKVV